MIKTFVTGEKNMPVLPTVLLIVYHADIMQFSVLDPN